MTTRLKRKRTEEWMAEVRTDVILDVFRSVNKHMGGRIHEVDFTVLCETIRKILNRPEYPASPFCSVMLNEIERMGPDNPANALMAGQFLLENK